MCGRFALKLPPAELITRFGLTECADFEPRFNIPPGTDIPVIRRSPEGARVLHLLRWGLVPHWAKDPTIGNRLANARGESVADKPAFREAFRKRRCLVPADGFYEWKTEGRNKQPYYFSHLSGAPLVLAGLWESWRAPDGTILRTVCLITTSANALMAPIHDRMPVLLNPTDWATWLEGSMEQAAQLIAPYADGALQCWPVDRRLNRPTEVGAGLIERVNSLEGIVG